MQSVTQDQIPLSWVKERVKRLRDHYESQSESEAIAEDEAAYEGTTYAFIQVPVELVLQIRDLIEARSASRHPTLPN